MKLRVAKRIETGQTCGTGTNGCGHKWATLEKARKVLRSAFRRKSRYTHDKTGRCILDGFTRAFLEL